MRVVSIRPLCGLLNHRKSVRNLQLGGRTMGIHSLPGVRRPGIRSRRSCIASLLFSFRVPGKFLLSLVLRLPDILHKSGEDLGLSLLNLLLLQ